MTSRPVDTVDLALLSLLAEDARMSVAQLAERAHVSRATAYSRVSRLHDAGVITGSTVTVDPDVFGLPVCMIGFVSMKSGEWPDWDVVSDLFMSMSEVEYAAQVTGEFDVVFIARLRDQAHLRSFLYDSLRHIPGYESTRTMIVLNETPRDSVRLSYVLRGETPSQ